MVQASKNDCEALIKALTFALEYNDQCHLNQDEFERIKRFKRRVQCCRSQGGSTQDFIRDHKRKCPDCNGTGKRKVNDKLIRCWRCSGKGEF